MTFFLIMLLLDPSCVFRKRLLARLFAVFVIAIIWAFPVLVSQDRQYATTVLVALSGLLLSLVVADSARHALSSLVNAGVLLSLVVNVIAFLPAFSRSLAIFANSAFLELDSGYLGTRDFGGVQLTMIHFRTSPLLVLVAVFLFDDSLEATGIRKRVVATVKFVMVLSAIVLSASRGLMVFTTVGILALTLSRISRFKYQMLMFLMGTLILFGISFALNNTTFFDIQETSNSIKLEHLHSYVRWTFANPIRLITGAGLGSQYLTEGFGHETWQTEIVILDTFRYFGILSGVLFTALLLLPIYRAPGTVARIAFGFYFINAFLTNPLVYNSTGMLVLALYWGLTINSSRSLRVAHDS